jgi:hypothetical protein
MSHYFDNNNRYQIIYPFTSKKIHVEQNLDRGANKCYQEIKDKNIKTYIFIVHDIDNGGLYYFNIPKFKNTTNNNDQGQGQTITKKDSLVPTNPDISNLTQDLIPTGDGCDLNDHRDNENRDDQREKCLPSRKYLNEHKEHEQNLTYKESKINRDNDDVIRRLNKVEYDLDIIKSHITHHQPKEESSCVIS